MNCMFLGRVWFLVRVIYVVGESGVQFGDRLVFRSYIGVFVQVEGSISFLRLYSGVYLGRFDFRVSVYDFSFCGFEGKKGG